MADIRLNGVRIKVVRKHVKNLHLSVHPPEGLVRISAPVHMEMEAIRAFARSKLAWIKKHQTRMRARKREEPSRYLPGETHRYLGERYRLTILSHQSRAGVTAAAGVMAVRLRGIGAPPQVERALDKWYRDRLRALGWSLIEKWEPILGVKVRELGIKRMKTRWGTCNARAGRVWLNRELIKNPIACVEYLVVHEMAHLRVCGHGREFKIILDRYVPGWRSLRRLLNDTTPGL